MPIDMAGQLYTIFTIINIILVIILLYYFLGVYRDIKSKFALGLVLFSLIFLVNALLRCPIFYTLFSTGQSCPYSPYYTAASGFEFLALLTLVYVVRK